MEGGVEGDTGVLARMIDTVFQPVSLSDRSLNTNDEKKGPHQGVGRRASGEANVRL